MTMERFMLDGYRDPELYQVLKDSVTFPLVREMEFKHGLKVLKKGAIRGVKPDRSSESCRVGNDGDSWVLAHTNGVVIGEVYMDKVYDHRKDQDVNTYMFYTPHFTKNRGRGSNERNTIQSTKISGLMAAIKRYDAIKTPHDHSMALAKRTKEAARIMSRELGDTTKSTSELSGDEIHALLSYHLGESPNKHTLALDKNRCQNILDKYEVADRIWERKKEEISRAFKTPFYIVGVDKTGEFIIGKAAYPNASYDDVGQVVITQDFKRYKSIAETEDGSLMAISTMIKVAYENNLGSTLHGFPITDMYNADLDVAFYYGASPSLYEHLWMVIPCNT